MILMNLGDFKDMFERFWTTFPGDQIPKHDG